MRVLIACESRQIMGYSKYLIGRDGTVVSMHRKEPFEVKTSKDAKGYRGLTLVRDDGAHAKWRIHRLVANAFIPNPDALPVVRHLDGNPENNNADNLSWGTHVENEADKMRHGTWVGRYGGAKLSASDRDVAKLMRADGMTMVAISARLGVSRPSISRLLSGRTWA